MAVQKNILRFVMTGLFSLGLISFGFVATANAQVQYPPELKASFDAINQKSVTSTVCFLSSDEMAGRDTPSPELTIASAYVAARFRGAGLKGGGDDGSYYLKTNIATVQLPTTGIGISSGGAQVQHFGLLSGDGKPFSYSGKLTFVSSEDDIRKMEFNGPVYFDPGDLSGRRAMGNLVRKTMALKQNGATAILLPTTGDSQLVTFAQQKAEPSMVSPRGGFAGPALLVSQLDPNTEYTINLPPQSGGQAEVRNVIGVLEGSDPNLKNEAIIITAHLDHVGHKTGTGDTVFNGADDNATGVTAVIHLAEAYAALPNPPKRTVIFMTFWGEEKGLLGSKHYVKHSTWPLDKIVANVNIEMIGRPEPGANEKCWVTGWEYSDLGPLMNQGAQSVNILIFEHPQLSGDMYYRASDNAPFCDAGVIAHSFSAGSIHEDYHQVGDHWQKLELKHMTRVIEGLFAGTLPMANGEVTPKKTGG